MKERTEKNVSVKSALKGVHRALCLMMCVMVVFFAGCMGENTNTLGGGEEITPAFDEKNVVVDVKVKDTLVFSEVIFNQNASLLNTESGVEEKFSPYTYFNVKLSKERIEVKSEDELKVKLIKQEISSKKPYKSDTEVGEDVVKVFEFDDGQVATCSYGYRVKLYNYGDGSLIVPHVEIADVNYSKHLVSADGVKNENEDPYRVDLFFDVKYTEKNVSGKAQSYTVVAKPWYKKFIVSEPLKVEKVSYKGEYEDCPISQYVVVEKVITNKGSFENSYRLPLNYKFNAPEEREQPTSDSIFSQISSGKIVNEEVFSEIKNDVGFLVRTMNGKYVSSNKGTKNGTFVESSIDFTYQTPVKLETEYGSFDITPLSVGFEEVGFEIEKIKETDEEISFKTLNFVAPKLGDCVLDEISQKVILKMALEKKPDVVKKDSVYTLSGSGDEYIVEKKIIWSDGSTSVSEYIYKGSHAIEKKDFGEVITSSLDWSEEDLAQKQTDTYNDTKKFSSSIYFKVEYRTNTHFAQASNKKESGVFEYLETTPIVSFFDGNIRKDFKRREFKIVDLKAKLDKNNPSEVVKNSVSYDAYDYDHSISYQFEDEKAGELVSEGKLLIAKDKEGEPKYEAYQTWNGNTTTVEVKKIIPHSLKDDEEVVYKTSFTVSLKDLENGKIYAENHDFSATEKLTNTDSSSNTDGFFVIKKRTRLFDYTVSNGVKERVMKTEVKDAEITFDDGTYKKVFDVYLTLNSSESFGSTFESGEYNVYPHKLKLEAKTSDAKKSLTTTGTTDIYVQKPKASYEKSQTWDGNTTTLIVKKTYDGKSETFKTTFNISLKDLNDGDVYAQNNSFSASKKEISNTSSSSKDGYFSISKRTRGFEYTVSNTENSRTMTTEVVDGKVEFDNGDYKASFDVYLNVSEMEKLGNETESGEYLLTKHTLDVEAKTVDGKTLKADGITNIYVKNKSQEPEKPHLGKPLSFEVTATYDPSSKVTRRAFCFTWEEGVTYAVCDYETMLPLAKDFMYKVDSYKEYNSVAKNKQGSWVPARGTDASDAMRWYDSNGGMIAGIDKAVSCKAIGWKNVSSGKYALVIKGYSYQIDGYTITITAPNGEKVSFNSHYTK